MRIMTSNIWGDYFDNPTRGRDDNLYRVYKKYSPDVIGFQEVTRGWYKSSLFERLRGEYYFVGMDGFDCNNYVPLAIKKDICLIDSGFEYLKDTPDSSKAITWAVVKQNGVVIGLCNTHFWWKRGDASQAVDLSADPKGSNGEVHCMLRIKNARQLTQLMKEIGGKYLCPVFAFGDMNATVTEGIFEVYNQNGIKNLIDISEKKDTACSIHGDPVKDENGVFHGEIASDDYIASLRREMLLPQMENCEGCFSSIDHIIGLGERFIVEQYRVIEDKQALDATDHSPVYADISFQI